MINEGRVGTGRRSGKDRRRGVDTRSDEERRSIGERRSGLDRRSGFDRRSRNKADVSPMATDQSPAQVYTFLPVVGGAGVTTLAVETAILLLRRNGPNKRSSTCLIDLDLQDGAIADYLDIEPCLDLSKIKPVERLDRQLLEVMISKHASGLAIVAAPRCPTERRSFDDNVVTRLLDVISDRFEFVVIDMPRSWFSWTENVLVGSDKLFIVSRATVPALRRTKQLVAAIQERVENGPRPQVLVNCFDRRIFSSSLCRRDFEKVLGETFAGTIPCDNALVREAIDRGVPLDEINGSNVVTRALKKLMLPQVGSNQVTGKFTSLSEKLHLRQPPNERRV